MLSEQFRKLSLRVGALSLRERVFVLAAAVIVIFSLVQILAIDSGQLRKRNAADRLLTAESTIQEIAQQQQALAGAAARNPEQAARNTLAAQEARLAGLNAELEARERELIPPERMQQMLKDVVQAQGGIKIVSFKTLEPKPVMLPGAAEGAPPGYYRHGFEVVVSGQYSELVSYLERLESLPWRLNWNEATLDTANRPELTLTLIIHTLSLEETWLRV